MQARFLLIPAAALTISAPAHATVYLSVEQAQALMFPGETLTPYPVKLTDAQISAIEDASDTDVRNKELMVWRASGGGWFIVDQVVGKHEFIPIALALDANGAVKDIEILEYRESYGDEVRNPKWRAQFNGKTQRLHAQADGGHQEHLRGDLVVETHHRRRAPSSGDLCDRAREPLIAALSGRSRFWARLSSSGCTASRRRVRTMRSARASLRSPKCTRP